MQIIGVEDRRRDHRDDHPEEHRDPEPGEERIHDHHKPADDEEIPGEPAGPPPVFLAFHRPFHPHAGDRILFRLRKIIPEDDKDDTDQNGNHHLDRDIGADRLKERDRHNDQREDRDHPAGKLQQHTLVFPAVFSGRNINDDIEQTQEGRHTEYDERLRSPVIRIARNVEMDRDHIRQTVIEQNAKQDRQKTDHRSDHKRFINFH
ncbi:hypothetical protein SDC9_29208 [bioreactor metagenome]|uniref:Uncharacterized protein n=1 Tax=bioreactor metagenome TaxID=1076179 RepID=A0A644UVZ4_9ZZZZ